MRLPSQSVLLLLSLTLGLVGCTASPDSDAKRCAPGRGTPVLAFELFFGRSVPGQGEISERDWNVFVDRVVVPAMPAGFTVYDATGAWMNPKMSKTIRESTKVLQVAMPDTPESMAAIQLVRDRYQVEFRQQLVGMTVATECGSF